MPTYDAAATVLVLAAILVMGGLSRWSFRNVVLIRDEGEIAHLAQEINRGGVPYRDVYHQKGPVLPYALALTFRGFGDGLAVIRGFTAVWTAVTAFLVFLVAGRLSNRVGGLVAALAFTVLALRQCCLAHSLNNEFHMNLWIMLALWLSLHESPWLHLLAGCAAGMAIAHKSSAAVLVVYLLLLYAVGWLLVRQRGRGLKDITLPALRSVAMLSGCAVVLIAWLAFFKYLGGMSDLVECLIVNLREEVALRPFSINRAMRCVTAVFSNDVQSATLLWLIGMAGFVAFAFRARHQANAFLGLLFLLLLATAIRAGFAHRHHYDIAIGVVAVGCGLAASSLVPRPDTGTEALPKRGQVSKKQKRSMPPVPRRWNGRWQRNLLGAALVLALVWPLWDVSRWPALAGGEPPFLLSPQVGAAIARASAEDDSILVFGSEPQIYVYAHRRSCSRHVIMYMLTQGFSFSERYQDELLRDLQQRRPAFLVGVNWLASLTSGRPAEGTNLLAVLMKRVRQQIDLHYHLVRVFRESDQDSDSWGKNPSGQAVFLLYAADPAWRAGRTSDHGR